MEILKILKGQGKVKDISIVNAAFASHISSARNYALLKLISQNSWKLRTLNCRSGIKSTWIRCTVAQ